MWECDARVGERAGSQADERRTEMGAPAALVVGLVLAVGAMVVMARRARSEQGGSAHWILPTIVLLVGVVLVAGAIWSFDPAAHQQ